MFGVARISAMRASARARMSADELMVALRRTGTTDIDEVAYAILEQDGSVSVLPRAKYRPATASDVGAETSETGIFHIIIESGCVNEKSLSAIGRDGRWLGDVLESRRLTAGEVWLMLADEAGHVRVFLRADDGGERKTE